MLERKYAINEDLIAEYFLLQETARSMLRVFEALFGLCVRGDRPSVSMAG
jgi:Zn-dependent oligopeptidase